MRWSALGACAAGLLLAGCASDERVLGLPSVSSAPAKITTDQLVGKWGATAYREEKDRARTITIAKQSCGNAMVIGKGPNGGVMWFVADSPDQFELAVRVGPDGKTYIGPMDQPAKSEWDREVISVDGGVITWRFVDPDNDLRYGTNVMVRCGAA